MFWPRTDPQVDRTTLPRHVTVRHGSPDDEYATFEVMRRTMGQDMAWSHHAAARRHLLHTDSCSYWVAEEKQRFTSPRIVGYARSVVRDGVWSLTEFFVLPGHHRQGIGGALLARCKEEGDAMGAHARLILASQHSSADSLYIRKLDCFPRLPMMMLAGPLSKLSAPGLESTVIAETALPFVDAALTRRAAAAVGELLRSEPIVLSPETQAEIDALDRRIVGYARPQEHAFWAREMGGPSGASRLFRRLVRAPDGSETLGDIAGYAYIGPHSSGPALAAEAADLPHMLSHVAALILALADADGENEIVQPLEHYWTLAGANEVVLRWLLECGWQIVFHFLFMSSRPM